MAALFLDEDVSIDLSVTLAQHGHFVTTTRGERRLGVSDPHQLTFAADRNWTIVTHNGRDFRLLHEAWLVDAITSLLADPDTSLETALYDWKRATGWTRFPG